MSLDCFTHVPNINKLLQTKDDASKAILSYINKTKEVLEGLSTYEFLRLQ
jgi:hypothetical protein